MQRYLLCFLVSCCLYPSVSSKAVVVELPDSTVVHGSVATYFSIYEEVNVDSLYPAFGSVFDLYMTSSISSAWDSTDVADFILLVMDDDSTNTEDVFPVVWNYFCRGDSDATYAGVEFKARGNPWTTYTKIDIYLYDKDDFPYCGSFPNSYECRGYSFAGQAQVYLNAEDKDPVEVARDAFAHEIQHIAFGASHTSFPLVYADVNESLSTLAEFMWKAWEVVPANADDQSYDASIITGQRCEYGGSDYLVWQVWMGYLFDQFRAQSGDPTDDLVYEWIRHAGASQDTITLGSLAMLLEDSDYSWLGGATGDERFASLVQYYAVAKFCDAPGFGSDERFGLTGSTHVSSLGDGFSPTNDLGFFLDVNSAGTGGTPPSLHCPPTAGESWNVRILPPEYELGSGHENSMTNVTGLYEDADGSKDSIDVAVYGTDYIVFRAGSYFQDSGGHEFHFAMRGDTDEPPSGKEVKVWVVGYSSDEDTLQLHPEDIVFIETVSPNPDSTTTSFVVTDFGRSIKSVVVVVTLVETDPSIRLFDDPGDHYFTYEYDYGAFTYDDGTVTWQDWVFVLGDMQVAEDATLAVEDGTTILVWPSDLSEGGVVDSLVEIGIYGELDVNGTSGSPVSVRIWDDALSGNDTEWYGITFHDSAQAVGELEHCVIENAYRGISAEVNLSISNTEIRNCDFGVYVSEGMDSVTLDSLLIEDIVTSGVEIHDASPVFIRNSTIQDCGDGDGVRVYSASGDYGPVIDNCTIQDADQGVAAGEVTVIKGSLIKNCRIGINVWSDSAFVDSTIVDSCTFAGSVISQGIEAKVQNSTFKHAGTYGIRVIKGATLYLDDTLFDSNYIGLNVAPVDAQTLSVGVEGCTFSDNTNHGVKVEDSSGLTISYSIVDDNTTSGIYCLDDGDATLIGNSITNNGVGVMADGSAPLVTTSNYIKSNTTGIRCDNNSDAVVESTVVESNSVGVIALNGSNPDLGTYGGGSSAGRNSFNNTTDDVRNLDSLVTVKAERNWWGAAPPDANKFVGDVDYTPYLSMKPSYEPQIEESFAYELPSTVEGAPGNDRVPTAFALSGSHPNPFNPTTTITFEVPEPGGMIQISIYNVRGQLVTTLLDDFRPAGFHSAAWNGRTRSGGQLSSGVYFVRMEAPAFVKTRKVILLK